MSMNIQEVNQSLSSYEMLGTSRSEEATKMLAICSLIAFFTYCAIKLFILNMIKQEEVDITIQQLREHLGQSLTAARDAVSQQADLQDDILILQERIEQFNEMSQDMKALRKNVNLLLRHITVPEQKKES